MNNLNRELEKNLVTCIAKKYKLPSKQVANILQDYLNYSTGELPPEQEEWQAVKDYEHLYEVSNFGRVRGANGIVRKTTINWKTGYRVVTLMKDKKKKTVSVHRMVAQAFIPNPHNRRCVNHKDSNRANNIVDNLEWVTHSQNQFHSYQSGRLPWNKGKTTRAKLTPTEVEQIRKEHATGRYSYYKLSDRYAVSFTTISTIINNTELKVLTSGKPK